MALVCAGWLHEVQWVLCTAFWSMDMTGVYACLFEAVCDVTTVPSHLNRVNFILVPTYIFHKIPLLYETLTGKALARVEQYKK